PSICRSPRPKKRVNYAEIDSSDEERESRKIRRTNNTTDLESAESPVPRTPPQAPRDLTTTPNKYSEDISIICAFDKSVAELTLEIGAELANKLYSVRNTNPQIWTPDLEKYIDNVLKKSGKQFKNAALVDVPDDLFRLYCEKVLLDFYNLVDINPNMDRKIGKHKYITYQISSIYKFYEKTFLNLDFDWIESHARSARIINSEIVRIDSIATRHYDGLDVWHMEVAGGPCNATDTYTLGDTKKTLRMDVLKLIAILRNHLDCNVELATKIKVFCTQVIGTRMTLYALGMLPDGRFISSELATAVVPFSFHGRSQFKAVFRMMAIFHDELTKQEELMGEIDRIVLRSKGTTVRHVLKIPRNYSSEFMYLS
ncbi:10662_t:CDS:2, partial [Paraglomus brasilianum]